MVNAFLCATASAESHHRSRADSCSNVWWFGWSRWSSVPDFTHPMNLHILCKHPKHQDILCWKLSTNSSSSQASKSTNQSCRVAGHNRSCNVDCWMLQGHMGTLFHCCYYCKLITKMVIQTKNGITICWLDRHPNNMQFCENIFTKFTLHYSPLIRTSCY